MKRTRLALVGSLVAYSAILVTCVSGGSRFTSSPSRSADLPGDLAKLVALSDRLVADPDASPRTLDRALAALEKASGLDSADAYALSWREAQAAIELSRLLDHTQDREMLLARARSAAHRATRLEERVEGHYYEALAIALQADVTQDMDLIKPLVAAAETAVALAPSYDGAAPLRLLGKVYLEAPEWPTSVGDRDEAVEVLKKAVTVSATAMNIINTPPY